MFQLQGWISEHEFGYTEVIRNPYAIPCIEIQMKYPNGVRVR